MASETRTTTDHEEIRQWVEAHGGRPASVHGTEGSVDPGVLRIDFPAPGGQLAAGSFGHDTAVELGQVGEPLGRHLVVDRLFEHVDVGCRPFVLGLDVGDDRPLPRPRTAPGKHVLGHFVWRAVSIDDGLGAFARRLGPIGNDLVDTLGLVRQFNLLVRCASRTPHTRPVYGQTAGDERGRCAEVVAAPVTPASGRTPDR